MKLLQLKDREYDNAGLIRTNASKELVTELWVRVSDFKYLFSEEEKRYLKSYGISDQEDTYCNPDVVSALLEMQGYEVAREWVEDITLENEE